MLDPHIRGVQLAAIHCIGTVGRDTSISHIHNPVITVIQTIPAQRYQPISTTSNSDTVRASHRGQRAIGHRCAFGINAGLVTVCVSQFQVACSQRGGVTFTVIHFHTVIIHSGVASGNAAFITQIQGIRQTNSQVFPFLVNNNVVIGTTEVDGITWSHCSRGVFITIGLDLPAFVGDGIYRVQLIHIHRIVAIHTGSHIGNAVFAVIQSTFGQLYSAVRATRDSDITCVNSGGQVTVGYS